MPASNVARLGFTLQNAKGDIEDTVQYWVNLTGGGMRPAPETDTRSETGLGRDVGATFIRVLSAAGDPSLLLRPDTAGLFYYAILGAKAAVTAGTTWTATDTYSVGDLVRPTTGGGLFEVTTAGTGGGTEPTWANSPDVGDTIADGTATLTRRFIAGTTPTKHTFTPANDQPYLTVHKELGDSIYEKFHDVKFTTFNMEFAAGGDLSASTNLMGLNFERLASSPGGGVHDQDEPYRVPGAVYTVDGVDDDAIASGSFNIEAQQNPIQTNQSTYSYIEPGTRTIAFAYERVYTTIAEYAKVYYGGPAGLTPSLQVWENTLELRYGPAGGPYVKYITPRAKYTEAGSDPDPGGAPMMLSTVGYADRPQAGNICTVEVLNEVASYAPPA
jgi:hypothetical protein